MTDDKTREALAEYAHTAWSGWMKYMFDQCKFQKDGTMVIPAWAVDRWRRQMRTDYLNIHETEKQSDRDEADKILQIVGKGDDLDK